MEPQSKKWYWIKTAVRFFLVAFPFLVLLIIILSNEGVSMTSLRIQTKKELSLETHTFLSLHTYRGSQDNEKIDELNSEIHGLHIGVKFLQSENKKLRKELDELKEELKDLQARHDGLVRLHSDAFKHIRSEQQQQMEELKKLKGEVRQLESTVALLEWIYLPPLKDEK